MILYVYARPRNEDTDTDIHVCDCNAMYCMDNKIVLREISHIFIRSTLWVHAKCAVKTRNRRFVYKRIYSHFFGRNALENRNAACETMIERLEYYDKKKSFNWGGYKNIHVEQHNIKAALTYHRFNDWSEE